jgi:hypothetical protein
MSIYSLGNVWKKHVIFMADSVSSFPEKTMKVVARPVSDWEY